MNRVLIATAMGAQASVRLQMEFIMAFLRWMGWLQRRRRPSRNNTTHTAWNMPNARANEIKDLALPNTVTT